MLHGLLFLIAFVFFLALALKTNDRRSIQPSTSVHSLLSISLTTILHYKFRPLWMVLNTSRGSSFATTLPLNPIPSIFLFFISDLDFSFWAAQKIRIMVLRVGCCWVNVLVLGLLVKVWAKWIYESHQRIFETFNRYINVSTINIVKL